MEDSASVSQNFIQPRFRLQRRQNHQKRLDPYSPPGSMQWHMSASPHAVGRWPMDMQGVQPQSLSQERESGPQYMTSTEITPVAGICIVFKGSGSQKVVACG